ncbi:hypothetical protein HJC23_010746 [Cyclotella cryptica]|uniref:EamA domain-containing protein n=1 Tax=Cyclotella cryptica TaxID=29204 RepID=A0ABD3PXB7_9STRA|eukprot:CCRYP_011076-RA/>CCRYP_011076-RA protein AED:0.03 eAED:0.03 QI:98/1/1/1/1/1/2/309/539
MSSIDSCPMQSTTPYRGSGPTETAEVLPSITSTNDAPPTPPSTSTTPNLARRRRSPNPTATSLLPDDEKEAPQHHEATRVNALPGTNPSEGFDGGFDEGQRATIRGMICRKSKAFMFGQLLSLFLAATGAVQSSLYLDCGLSAPTFSMFSFYLPLCIICISRLLREAKSSEESYVSSSQEEGTCHDTHQLENDLELKTGSSGEFNNDGVVPTHSNEEDDDDPKLHKSCNNFKHGHAKQYSLFRIVPLQSSPWRYAMVAVADVYANYATILAFKYTTITSVSLFDALAIPSAMLVSLVFFGRKYTKVHLAAVVVCCIGITINVLQDYSESERLKESGGVGKTAQEELIEQDYPYKLAGDALAITGGILFGISNTLAEVAVRDWGSQYEFLGAMTFFASIITFIQTLATEQQEVMAFFGTSNDSCSELGSLTLMALFVIASTVNYMGIATFLRMSDAAFLNLSLLTGDAWAVAFSVIAEGIIPPVTFYIALVITVSGVFIYETAPSPVVDGTHDARTHQESEIEMDEIRKRSNISEGHILT